MKLIEIWRKVNKAAIVTPEKSGEDVEVIKFKSDSIDLYLREALEVYCKAEDRVIEEILAQMKAEKSGEVESTGLELRLRECAGNHIVYFVVWLIEHNLYIADIDLEKVKNREVGGYSFLVDNCSGKFTRGNLDVRVYGFVDKYYNKKFKLDYKDFVEMVLGEEVYGVTFSWEEYDQFKGLIDIAYENYKLKTL